MGNKMALPKVEQVAIICRDREATAAFLTETLGIGPFVFSERNSPVIVDGKPSRARRKLAIAPMGGVDLELIQPMEPGTPYYNFVMARGEGLQHIRFAPVDDLKATVAELEKRGYKTAYAGDFGGHSFAYLESEKAKGFILEFVGKTQP